MQSERLAIVTTMFAALNIYAQGDVQFENFFGGIIHNYRTGTDVSTADGMVVQLYASSSEELSTFRPVPGSIVQIGIIAPGYFDGGTVRIPASIIGPGAGVFLFLRGWETAYGATFNEAGCRGAMGGRLSQFLVSQTFSVSSTGNPLVSPPEEPVSLSALIPVSGFTAGPSPCDYLFCSDRTVPCNSPAGAVVTFAPSPICDCGPEPSISCDPPSGSLFPVGTSYVLCTGTDESFCRFRVTVEDPAALSISWQADAAVVITWRQTCTSYLLEQTESSGPLGQWTAVMPLTSSDATNSVTLPISAPTQFYRLQKPSP